jgi:hypothetical protein
MLPKIVTQNLDDVQHRKRIAESINNILDFSFDDSRLRTAAEIAAGVTPTNYAYAPGYQPRYGTDYASIVSNLAQAALSGGSPAKLAPATTYNIGANTIAIPDGVQLDLNGADIVTTDECAFTFGSGSILLGYGASITTSGASGAAIKKTSTASSSAWYIYGWPSLTATTMGTAGSIGLDITAAYKGVFEIAIEGYETLLLGGAGTDPPQTYYNEIRSPRLRVTSGVTGIYLRTGCNGTLISNPQINGANNATYLIRADSMSGLVVEGGYLEGAVDAASTRGMLLNAVSNALISGPVFEIGTSVAANFAIGGSGANDNVSFVGCGFAGAWGNSGKIMTWAGGGKFNFSGGAPSNMLNLVGQTAWVTGETNGTVRTARNVITGKIEQSVSAAADTAASFDNSGDGIGAYVANNSATKTAGRTAQVINRVGGPGYALAFQNNGAASGGIVFCAGTPESQITAVVGTIAMRTDGGASTTLYVKESGSGNMGWVAK